MSEPQFSAPGNMVRVKNTGEKPLRIAFNSRVTVINPGEQGFVEREAACAHFGVWDSVRGGKPIDRHNEWLRIQGLYGNFPGGPANENKPVWEEVRPYVDIYEADGTKVSTVLDDPEGEHVPVREGMRLGGTEDIIARMQEQIEQLKEQNDQILAANSLPELPDADSPDNAPKKNRQQPKLETASGE